MKIRIKVIPNSSKEEIISLDKNNYKVYLKKQAHDGKANEELTKILKRRFKRDIKIIKGRTSRNKTIEVN